MEVDEYLNKTLYAPSLLLLFVTSRSLQFDPAPRKGEPMVTRRTPEYFL
jgi:hypothetical protein